MKVLICKDELNNTLIESRILPESDSIKYSVIENAPTIEVRENEIGHYELSENGELVIVYEPIPPTIEQKLEEQDRIIADLMLEIALLQGGTK